jgi:sugar lactone lactonase YvrE
VIAGDGTAGFAGDGSPADRASFRNPEWVDHDSQGHLWIADRGNGRVRVVDRTTGLVRTAVGGPNGGLTSPFGLVVGAKDTIFVFDTDAHTIRRVEAGGLVAVVGDGIAGFRGDRGPGLAARTRRPHNGVFDAAGRLVFGDSFNHRIRRWDPVSDRIDTIAGTGEEGAPTVGGLALQSALGYFGALAVEGDGSVVFTSTVDNRILRVRGATGRIEVVAGTGREGFSGDGGPAVDAQLRFPYGLAIDDGGSLYVADAGNRRIRRINRGTGAIETIAGG